MTYPLLIEEQLGFDHIRESLEQKCLCALGRTRVSNLRYLTSLVLIKPLLDENLEMSRILSAGETPSFQFFTDPAALTERISPEGGFLEGVEYLQLAQAMQTAEEWISALVNEEARYPRHTRLANSLLPARLSSKIIFDWIDERGEVRDRASSELQKIRRRIQSQQATVRQLNDQAFRAAVANDFVPAGALPTIREGRMVIPILAIHKRKFKGLVLDESATGQTVYMESAELLEVNNELKELAHAERREVIRILKSLADRLRLELPWLDRVFDFMGFLDFNRAKALLSIELKSVMPELVQEPALQWTAARHPLLIQALKGKRELVPLTIDLTNDDRMMLISGPNAGGKSVCLKTVGLLQYMLQCGLLVPVGEDSRFGIFKDLLVDIGDQQSIENDLSTYSSHLANMGWFMKHASPGSLILMDELGSGTDPNFGGAIAQAVLEALLKNNAWGLATTHYYNLKLFASNRSGIRNASMRFDEERLQPLYKLEIGNPGSSFALEIARKTGIPETVIERAEELAGEELTGLEKLLRDLQQERQELDRRLEELHEKERSLVEEVTRHRQLASDLDSRKKEILEKARGEADAILKRTNKEIEKTIRHIRENRAERNETRKIRKQLEGIADELRPQQEFHERPASAELAVGDRVRIPGQEGSGLVVSLRKNRAVVQFGEVITTVPVSTLLLVQGPPQRTDAQPLAKSGFDLPSRQSRFEGRLDLRGRRAEEVAAQLEQFLDDGFALGYHELYILHGKGEGVLRQVVRSYLAKDSRVARFADEHVERGGSGITVVTLT